MAGEGVFPKDNYSVVYLNDYNSIQNTIKTVLTDYYGQACYSSQLTTKKRIEASEWNLLRADINSCIKHQTGSNTGISLKGPSLNVTAADVNEFWGGAGAALSNKQYVYQATQMQYVANAATSSRNGTTSPWIRQNEHIVQINWATAAKANYFFNCGGYITVNASASYNATVTAKDTNWYNIVSRVGTRVYNGGNWSTGGSQIICNIDGTQYYSSTFAANYFRITATRNSDTQLQLNILFKDDYTGPPDDPIHNTHSTSVGYWKSIDAIVSPWPGVTTIQNL